MNLTGQQIDDWRFHYFKSKKLYELTKEKLTKIVVCTSEEYKNMVDSSIEESIELDNLRAVSGIKIQPKKINDPDLRILQSKAGII